MNMNEATPTTPAARPAALFTYRPADLNHKSEGWATPTEREKFAVLLCAHFDDEQFEVDEYVRALDGVSLGQLCQVSLPAMPSPAELREDFKLDQLGKPQKRKPVAPQASPGQSYNTCRYGGCEIPTAGRAGSPCVFHEAARNRLEIDAITAAIGLHSDLAYVWFRLAHGMHQHWARDWQIFGEHRFHQSATGAGVAIADDERWLEYRERVRLEVRRKIQEHQPVMDLRRDARAAL